MEDCQGLPILAVDQDKRHLEIFSARYSLYPPMPEQRTNLSLSLLLNFRIAHHGFHERPRRHHTLQETSGLVSLVKYMTVD